MYVSIWPHDYMYVHQSLYYYTVITGNDNGNKEKLVINDNYDK